jgi:hypothetical protein
VGTSLWPGRIEVLADDANCTSTAVAIAELNDLARICVEGNPIGKRCGIRDGFYHVAHTPYVPFRSTGLALVLLWGCSVLH